MQEVFHLNCRSSHLSDVPYRLFPVFWMLLPSLLVAGCGGAGEDGTSHAISFASSIAAPQQASSRPSGLAVHNPASKQDWLLAPTVPDDTAALALKSASLAQISALPHLSALSPREKAGLLLLLPSKSSSQRLALIEMYPSLSQLPVQQKQVLLDKLEKIVPVANSQSR